MNLSTILRTVAQAHPSQPAIVSADAAPLSYSEFERAVAQIAAALRDRHGLVPGDRVVLWLENEAAFFLLLYGIWRAGLAAVPVNAKLHAKELAWIAGHCGAKLIFASRTLADQLGADLGLAAPVLATGGSDYARLFGAGQIDDAAGDPGAEAWLFYTSGTTGRPKGAILTQRNLLFACHAYYADIDFLDTRDAMLHAAPLSHGSGLYGLAAISRGARQIIHAAFDPARILDVFERERHVSMFAAPTMLTRLVHHAAGGGNARGLKCLIYGGGPMYVADLVAALDRFGPRLYQLYGQGESPMTITGLDRGMHAAARAAGDHALLASAGIARTGVAWRIVDADQHPLPDGAVGEIVTKSDGVMRGYLDDPEANARALRDGWLWTGDLGSRDARGLLTLKDRSKDLIISGGSNIYPREIEDVLLTHPDIVECAVVSRPHPDWGEEVVAFVVARPGATPPPTATLDALCLANIARFKRPKAYRLVEALPKNNYGKVLKTELRRQLLALADP
jgi:acyl-CoA synthetase (AMP-forming)/AMP-acid ligase II